MINRIKTAIIMMYFQKYFQLQSILCPELKYFLRVAYSSYMHTPKGNSVDFGQGQVRVRGLLSIIGRYLWLS